MSIHCPSCGTTIHLTVTATRENQPNASRPAVYADATSFARFIESRCVLTGDDNDINSAADIRTAYWQWCDKTGQPRCSARTMGVHLKSLGLKRGRTATYFYWCGLRLK